MTAAASAATGGGDTLLRVRDLKVHFPLRRAHPFAPPPVVHAVDGVSFEVRRGATFGLVGESGSGKTTTALAITRLTRLTGGSVRLGGTDLATLSGEALRWQRRQMQIIFQDPYSALNPRLRAGAIVCEPLDQLGIGAPDERDARVAELFRHVGLRPEQRALFPHQFSGGQRQRIGIARALATQPDLIVCDEPVSALDVAIQAQILNLLRRLQREFGLTYLFISHDLGVVQYMCDEVAVMYLGQIVEHADRLSLFRNPAHPYTWALLSAVPSADPRLRGKRERVRLVGDPPSPVDLPQGCRFASRCPFAEPRCHAEAPALRRLSEGHAVACHLVDAAGHGPHRRATAAASA
jgi:peptide/nickel transport system ATP-binding protein